MIKRTYAEEQNNSSGSSGSSGCAIIGLIIIVVLYWLAELYKMIINFPIIGLKVFDSTYEIEIISTLHLFISLPFCFMLFFLSKMVKNIRNDDTNSIIENRYKYLFVFLGLLYTSNMLVYYGSTNLSYVLILLSIILFWVLFKKKTSVLSTILLLIPILSVLVFSLISINPNEKIFFEYKELSPNSNLNYLDNNKVINLNGGDTVALVIDKFGDTTDVYIDGHLHKLNK
jgi:hypothetical protein